MSPETAEAIVRITMTYGGGTFDRRGALIERDRGYVVGIHSGTFLIFDLENSELVSEGIQRLLSVYPTAFIGTWFEKGKIHLDPVEIYEDRDSAEGIGRITGQKAIYSFESGVINLE